MNSPTSTEAARAAETLNCDRPIDRQLLEELSKACAQTTLNEALANHTTWGIGGPARYFAEPSTEDEIVRLIRIAGSGGVPFAVIGHGSNLLVGEKGVEGLVIKLGARFSRIVVDGLSLDVQAGAYVPHVARTACLHGLSGIEHIVGIPGSFGGLIAMNGGSRRQNIGDAVRHVRVVNRSAEVFDFEGSECGFGYRKSRFQQDRHIVLEAVLSLREGLPRDIRRESLEILRERRGKFPQKTRNCGSVFLSSPDMYQAAGPPGKVIESAGLKGRTHGGLHVSHRHANFIVNDGTGTFSDAVTLITEIRDTVYAATGFRMACEVRFLSESAEFCSVSDILPEDPRDI